jgi:hypothetical protein
MNAFANLIGGRPIAVNEVSRNINPSDTTDVVGEYARGSAADAAAAIDAAATAFPAWSRTSPQLRHDVLKAVGDEILARKDELGRLLAREEGKTLPEATGEVIRAGQIFLFFSGEALRLGGETFASVRPGVEVDVTREPVGAIALITPWNFPIAIPAWKIAPRRGGGEGAAGQRQGRRDFIHRLGGDRTAGGGGLHGGCGDEKSAAGDGRQEPARRPRRRRPRRCRGLRRQRRLLRHRPALHRVLAVDRHRRHP